jgi:hypothetical protein
VHRIGEWLLEKNMHAALVAFVCTLLPLVGLPGDFLASIIVAFVTLRKGMRQGLYILAWVALPSIALLFLHEMGTFDVMLARCIIVWLIAGVLHKTHSWARVLYVLVIIGLIGVTAFHAVVSDPIGWWASRITAYLASIAKEAQLPASELTAHATRLATFATGLMTMVILLGVFLQLMIARFWQAAIFNKGGLRHEGLNIRMSHVMSIVLMVAFIASLFHVAIIVDWLPVLLLPFLIAGLSLLHMCVEQKRVWIFGMAFLYVAMVLVPYIAGVVALIGFIDSWLDIRKKYQLTVKT